MQLNEFLQSEIKQKLSSVLKITCISATADKKIKNYMYSVFSSGLIVLEPCVLSGQLPSLLPPPPRKIAPRLGLEFWSRLGLVLGLGGNQTIALEKNWPLVRVRVWVWVSFGVERQFSLEAIVLEPFCVCEVFTPHLSMLFKLNSFYL